MNCFVIGNGGWGTALGMVLAGNGHEVTLWGPFEEEIQAIRAAGENTVYLPGVELPQNLSWTSDPATVKEADLVVLVVPSRFVRATLETFKPHLPKNALIVSATKGLDEQTHQRISEIAADVLGHDIAILSGPSHAEEVARGVPTAVTIAGKDFQCLEKIQATFSGKTFRVYTSDDVIGVELGGTLKNIIAVAAGILDGIGLGDNSKAALMTRGLAEISRLGTALGAKPETFSGLSGVGDLIVTATSRHSRNRNFGEALAKGLSIQSAQEKIGMVVEGITTAISVAQLAHRYNVDMPISTGVYEVLYKGKSPKEVAQELMLREPKPEIYGI